MSIPKPSKRGPKLRRKPRRKRKGKRASIARECDRLWSLIVKSRGGCEVVAPCCEAGNYQAAHGISRRYRATRWLPINGFKMCRACHVYYTHRPLEWDFYLLWEAWGQSVNDELRRTAIRNEKQDMPSVLEKLRDEAKRLGIE